MPATAKPPKTIAVLRSELRQDQSAVLKRASGDHIVVVRATSEDKEKYIVDKQYFDDLLKQLRSAIETLEITADTKFFSSLLAQVETVDEDLRLGKLHSFEEVTQED